MNNKIELVTAGILGLLMVVFGLNKFLNFAPVEPPTDPIAQQYLGAMFSSYLYVMVGLVEIIGGLFLVIPSFRRLGYLLLAPIVFNIVAFHVAHDFIGNGIWLLPSALFLVVSYYQMEALKTFLLNPSNK